MNCQLLSFVCGSYFVFLTEIDTLLLSLSRTPLSYPHSHTFNTSHYQADNFFFWLLLLHVYNIYIYVYYISSESGLLFVCIWFQGWSLCIRQQWGACSYEMLTLLLAVNRCLQFFIYGGTMWNFPLSTLTCPLTLLLA